MFRMKTLESDNHDKDTNAGNASIISIKPLPLKRQSVSGYMCMDGWLGKQSKLYVNVNANTLAGQSPKAKKNTHNAGLRSPLQINVRKDHSRKRQRDSSGESEVFAYIPEAKVKRTVNSGNVAQERITGLDSDRTNFNCVKMSAKQSSNRNFAQKIRDTFLPSKSDKSEPKVPLRHRGRSKSWSKADRGREKVKCKDKRVTLTTENCNYESWNSEFRQNGEINTKSSLSDSKCVTSGHVYGNIPGNKDFSYKTNVIYYPSGKRDTSHVTVGDRSENYNSSQGKQSPNGFSLRKLLHLKPKHGKEDSCSDDSNNNYCYMEKLNGLHSEKIAGSDKVSTRHHDYCTDLDPKSDKSEESDSAYFKRAEAIYGTGKRRSRRNYAIPEPGRGQEPPPLPKRPSSIPQEPINGQPEQPRSTQADVIRRPSISLPVAKTPYGGSVPARAQTPVKEQDVTLVKTLRLDFLQKSVISGVAVTRKQEYVVVDLREAYIVDDEGHLKKTIGTKGCSQRLHEPIAVTTMDGNLVFSDHAHQEVKIYSVRGQFLKKVADKSLCNIAGVAVNDKREIFICGTDKQRVSVHSEEDELLFTIPSSQSKEKSGSSSFGASPCKRLFDHPYSIAINPLSGDIIVGDDYEQKVTAVSKEGRVLWRFVPASKYTERAFFPCSIAVDPLGYVFIADLLNANVYMLDSSGRFLKTLLSKADGLTTGPAAIATDGKGQLIVADDDRTLKVFRYGNGDQAIPRRVSVVPQL